MQTGYPGKHSSRSLGERKRIITAQVFSIRTRCSCSCKQANQASIRADRSGNRRASQLEPNRKVVYRQVNRKPWKMLDRPLRLNSGIRPRNPELGWRVGDGVFEFKYKSVKILLTERKGCHDVLTNYALIAYNVTTGSHIVYVTP